MKTIIRFLLARALFKNMFIVNKEQETLGNAVSGISFEDLKEIVEWVIKGK